MVMESTEQINFDPRVTGRVKDILLYFKYNIWAANSARRYISEDIFLEKYIPQILPFLMINLS